MTSLKQTEEASKRFFQEARAAHDTLLKREKTVLTTQAHINNNTFPKNYDVIHFPAIQHPKNATSESILEFEIRQGEILTNFKKEGLRNELHLYSQRLQEAQLFLERYLNPAFLSVYITSEFPDTVLANPNFVLLVSSQFKQMWSAHKDKRKQQEEAEAKKKASMDIAPTLETINRAQDVAIKELQKELQALKLQLNPPQPPEHRGRGRATTRGSYEERQNHQEHRRSKSGSRQRHHQDYPTKKDGGGHGRGRRSQSREPHSNKSYKSRGKNSSIRSPSRSSRW